MPHDITSLLITPTTSRCPSDPLVPCVRSSDDWQTAILRTIFGIGISIGLPRLFQLGRRYHIGENSQVLLALIPRGLLNAPNLRSLWENRENPRAANGINDLRGANLLTQENFNAVIQNLGTDLFLDGVTHLRDQGRLTQNSFQRLVSLAANPHFVGAIALLHANHLLTTDRFNSLQAHAETPRFLEAIPLLAQNGLLTADRLDPFIALIRAPRFLTTVFQLSEMGRLTERNFGSFIAHAANPRFLEATLLLSRNHLLTDQIFHSLLSQLDLSSDVGRRHLDHLTTAIGQLHTSAPALLTQSLVSQLIDHLPDSSRLLNALIQLERSHLSASSYLPLLVQHPQHADTLVSALSALRRQNLLGRFFPAFSQRIASPRFLEIILLLFKSRLLNAKTLDRLISAIPPQSSNFEGNLSDLGRVIDYLNGRDPHLLRENLICHLIERLRYAPRLLNGIRILHSANLSNGDPLSYLLQHPQYAENLAFAIRSLHHHNRLQEDVRIITSRPQAIHILGSAGLLNDHLPFLARHPEGGEELAHTISTLHHEGLSYSLLSKLISHIEKISRSPISSMRMQSHLRTLIPYARQFGRAMVVLEPNHLLETHLDILLTYPSHAESLALGIRTLNTVNFRKSHLQNLMGGAAAVANLGEEDLLQIYRPLLLKHAAYAESLAKGIVCLFIQKRFLLDSHLWALIDNPEYAELIALGILELNEAKLLKTHLGILIQHPQYALKLGRAIRILQGRNLLEKYLPVLLQKPDCAEPLARGIATLDEAASLSIDRDLLQCPQHADLLAKGVILLPRNDRFQDHLKMLLKYPDHAQTIAILIQKNKALLTRYLNILIENRRVQSNLDRAILLLFERDFATQEYLHLILAHPLIAFPLGDLISELSGEGMFRPYLDLVIQHPEAAKVIVAGAKILKERALLRVYFERLRQHPEMGRDLADVLSELHGQNEVHRAAEILIANPKYTDRLRQAILLLKKDRIAMVQNLEMLRKHPKQAIHLASIIRILCRYRLLDDPIRADLDRCAFYAEELLSSIEQIDLFCRSRKNQKLESYLPCLFRNAPYQTSCSKAIQILMKHHLDSSSNLEKIGRGEGACMMSLIEYDRSHPGEFISQETFDQIMARAPKREPLSVAELLSRWSPTYEGLSGDLVDHVLSFLEEG